VKEIRKLKSRFFGVVTVRILRSTGHQGSVPEIRKEDNPASPPAVGVERIALATSINSYELTAHALFTLRAAVLEWDEPSAWAQIWALAFAAGLLLASVLPWESK